MQTPYLTVDLDTLRRTYRGVAAAFMDLADVYYSIKANNLPEVLRTIFQEGGRFDVASLEEIKMAMAVGAAAEDLMFSNPIKIQREVAEAYRLGVRWYAFDSEEEIRKLAGSAPGSKVYCRLVVPNDGSLWPLKSKFGVSPDEAIRLLEEAGKHGLEPAGVAFHVGSQCLNPTNWRRALELSAHVFKGCSGKGIGLRLINMGGGLPAMDRVSGPPRLEEITTVVRDELTRRFSRDVKVVIEPGRHVAAPAGLLTTSVIGKAKRDGKEWIYLDVGIWNGLEEVREDYPYELTTEWPDAPRRNYVIAGPTCDSVDVLFWDKELPEVQVGDKVFVHFAGAYTVSMQRYNGFTFPSVEFRG